MSDSSSINGDADAMFQEPEGYYQATEKPFSHETFVLEDGRKLDLRLVGHNPLWGHLLWNGARTLTTHLQSHTSLVKGRTILELGAGAGLPSLACTLLDAAQVVVTDYPDADLIENLRFNISTCIPSVQQGVIAAEGYLWGAETGVLTQHLPAGKSGFDTILMADLLFNHSEHAKLVRTLRTTLARTSSARALVFFTPYRPWLLAKDLAFFELVEASNAPAVEDDAVDLGSSIEGRLGVRNLFERVLERVMFEEDPGDEKLRRTVFGYEVVWEDLVAADQKDGSRTHDDADKT